MLLHVLVFNLTDILVDVSHYFVQVHGVGRLHFLQSFKVEVSQLVYAVYPWVHDVSGQSKAVRCVVCLRQDASKAKSVDLGVTLVAFDDVVESPQCGEVRVVDQVIRVKISISLSKVLAFHPPVELGEVDSDVEVYLRPTHYVIHKVVLLPLSEV